MNDFSLSDSPTLQRMQRALRNKLTCVWPTRNLPLCPPAYAGLVETAALDMPDVSLNAAPRTLVVFLPDDYRPYLRELVTQIPRVRIHPDISLLRQVTYLSWSASVAVGTLPLTLWVKAKDVLSALDENAVCVGTPSLPLVLVAGESVMLGGFVPDCVWRTQCNNALAACEAAPNGYSEQELTKASEKAEKYSEQPWLFMRYELKSGHTRLAVNWAPVQRMVPAPAA